MCKWVSGLIGFPSELVYLDNLPRFAHALCADNLVNLHDFAAQDGIRPDDHLLLLGTGPIPMGCRAR